ncbi:A disintegrin and metalloproteinase with thrombospondin motifs 16 [Armadillidium vulgare]|nr:A disintegrin and metalloproteinase with thrombospondin motifs 16 [Armadillidium vulgare]
MEINFPRDTEEQVIEVVLAMVNAVQLLYNDPSLGHKIKYVLKRLELLYQDPPGLSRPHDIDLFLTKFCMWQNTENPPSDDENLHWDHALILTGLDLYTIMDDRKLNSQVVGLAPVAGMCTRTSSCTVNEGRHFESVYVVAHEIGHNLGMRHDGLQSGNNCDPSGYLMSPTLGSGKVTWSHCSKRYLNNFLRLSQSKCLRDKPLAPPDGINHEGLLLPGQRFSAEQQCKNY